MAGCGCDLGGNVCACPSDPGTCDVIFCPPGVDPTVQDPSLGPAGNPLTPLWSPIATGVGGTANCALHPSLACIFQTPGYGTVLLVVGAAVLLYLAASSFGAGLAAKVP